MRKRPPKFEKTDNKESRYIKVLSTESVDKFEEIGKLVKEKKIKWVFHKIENSVGVHYYLKTDKNKTNVKKTKK